MNSSSETEGYKPDGRPPDGEDFEKTKGGVGSKRSVPLYRLFSFPDAIYIVLMTLGAIAAIFNGMSVPLMAYLVGQLVDSFGKNAHNKNLVHEVSKIGKSIQLIIAFIGGFLIAFMKGWLLVLVFMSTVPLLVLSGASMSIIINNLATRGQVAYSEAGAIVEQTISSIRTVASFTGERQAINRYNKSLDASYKSSVQEGFAGGIGIGMVMFIVFSSYGLAAWFGAIMIIEKGYTGGDVVCVIFAVVTSSMSLGEASPCMKAFAAGQAAAFNMFETIYRKPDIDSFDTNGCILDDISGDIELKDIHFSYPARPREKIFAGFSLSIPSGTITALVGESGSGKSTVISLIERFYDQQAGEVLIDGINLKEFLLR
ncbi:hypothetical protein IFM89_029389 [Coptis chinensis]|uniref:ABC transmembrane type-1 domain-containing protein n=1 Tax=Coptis chinensis TaxID=261450 RepID=A0A835M7H2_9MAGN|nr:hypothetical protein IFM89_029389 [Coptis chinensis]